jgi:hypothetical protein
MLKPQTKYGYTLTLNSGCLGACSCVLSQIKNDCRTRLLLWG